jgi:hypothetical protein
MEGQDRKFRIAPAREHGPSSENLDAMIVIPSMNEGEKIIDTIYTAVHQQSLDKQKLKHGVVVVINNRPTADDAVKLSNFRTYLLLQALEHKFPITLGGNKAFNQKAKFIQEQNIPIHIVDSFSEGYSSPDSNVGRARRIGTEVALPMIKKEGFIVSTDADTVLGNDLIGTAKLMFEMNEGVVGTRIHMSRHLAETNIDEKRASAAEDIYWGITHCIDTDPAYIEDEFVWMAGAGSAFRADNYKKLAEKGRGYSDVPGHEDTLLGTSLADEGWVIRDMSKEFRSLQAMTRQRFSERASTGYGRHMLNFDPGKIAFRNILVESPAYEIQKDRFFSAVENIYIEDLAPHYDRNMDQPIDDLYGVFSNRTLGNAFVEQFIVDTKEQAVEKFSALCDEFSIETSDKEKLCEIYRRWKPNQEMGLGHHDFIEAAKKIFEKKYPKITMEKMHEEIRTDFDNKNAAEADQSVIRELDERFPDLPRTIEGFERRVLEQVEYCGVDTANEDTLLKVRCVILSAYSEVHLAIKNLMRKEAVEVDRERLKNSTDPKDLIVSKILQQLEVPKGLVVRKVKQETLWGVAKSVADVRNALLWEQPQKISDALENRSNELAKESADFYEQFMKADAEAFKASSSDVVERVEKALAEADSRQNLL